MTKEWLLELANDLGFIVYETRDIPMWVSELAEKLYYAGYKKEKQ